MLEKFKSFIRKSSHQSGPIKDVVLDSKLTIVEMLQSDVARGVTWAAFELGRVYAFGLLNAEQSYEIAFEYYMCAGMFYVKLC